MTYYVYAHYKKGEENIPFYVGKGRKRRAWQTNKRSEFWHNVVKKYGCDVRILYDDLSESDAFWIECKLIEMFGRADKGLGPLVNHTDGGEGASGNIQSKELKKQKSKKMKGRVYDEERRNNIAKGKIGNNYNKGKALSEDRKRKISKAQLGEKNHRYGISWSEEEKIMRSKTSPLQKRYEIEKDGIVEIIIGLNSFCKKHNLVQRSMHRACTNGYRHRGYSIKRLV
jgi:hypothetical protein